MLLALSLSQKESPNSNTSYQYFYKKILWLKMQDTYFLWCDTTSYGFLFPQLALPIYFSLNTNIYPDKLLPFRTHVKIAFPHPDKNDLRLIWNL